MDCAGRQPRETLRPRGTHSTRGRNPNGSPRGSGNEVYDKLVGSLMTGRGGWWGRPKAKSAYPHSLGH